jgi:hypothetical protein
MKKIGMKFSLLVVTLLFWSGLAVSDTLELNDGSVVTGKFIGRTGNGISFEVDGITMTYPASNVKAITKGDSEPVSAPAPVEPPASTVAPVPQPASVPSVPAGTRVMVRMRDSLDSARHGSGHVFAATLDSDLYAGSTLVAPRGSNVYGRLTGAKKSGRMVGQAELKVELTDIVIDGKPFPAFTRSVKAVGERTGASTVKRTAVSAGIGALLKSDSRKGAKQGAAVGLGVSALTGGSQVRIPAGALLEFRLAAPFTPL